MRPQAGDGAHAGEHDVDEVDGAASPRGDDRQGVTGGTGPRWLPWALLAVVDVPIVVATVRGLARGWLPLGDNGVLLVQALDVGTEHHHLVGPWSSASLVVGETVRNPGPLYYDLLAPFVRVLGPWVGLAVGVMAVNVAASSLAVVAARRLGGTVAMVGVAAAVVGLQYAMGSELLYDVWQPNALVLPYLALLVVAAAVARGDPALVPWLVGLGSLVVQTHLSQVVVVGVACTVALGACAWQVRRVRQPARWRRPLVAGAVVAVAAWCQPVIEELRDPGDGNLSRLVRAAASGGAGRVGLRRGGSVVGELLLGSPWFARDTYSRASLGGGLDGPADRPLLNALVVVAVTAALVVAARWDARHGRRGLAVLAGLAAVMVVATVVAVGLSPRSIIGVSSHQMRWAWVAAALAWAALLCALLAGAAGGAGRRQVPGRPAPATTVAVAALSLVAVANLPTHHSGALGPELDHAARPALRELVAGARRLDGRGTVLFDLTGVRFNDPYSFPVVASLLARGVPVVFDGEVLTGYFGEGRRHDGTADLRAWLVEGPEALEPPPGVERVALAEGPRGPVALFAEPHRPAGRSGPAGGVSSARAAGGAAARRAGPRPSAGGPRRPRRPAGRRRAR